MGRVKVFFSILVVFLILVFSTKPVFAWKFAVMGDTRPGTSYDHSQNAYGISLKIPNSTRVTVFENGDLTLDGTDSQWVNYRSIISTPLDVPTNNSGWINSYGIPKIISSVGNHDTHQSGWQTRWQTYLPAQAGLTAYSDIPAHPQGLYGSVKYQNAIFVWVDYYSMPSGQEAFLRDTLVRAKSDPQVVWKFVSYHSPAVSCGGEHSDWTQGKIWHDNYFYPNGVDLVFTGDNHYYERDCPFKSGLAASGSNEQNVCDTNNMGNIINNPDGVIHIVSGGGGAELYPVGNCPYLAKNQNGQNAAFSIHQFMDIEINGNSLHTIVYDTDTGVGTNPVLTSANFQVIDDFTITKTTGPTPTQGAPMPTSSIPTPTSSIPTPTTSVPTTPPIGCFNSVPVYGQLPMGTVAACTTSLRFSWTDNPVVDHYALRIDEDPVSWSGNCTTVNPSDTCIDYLYGNSYTRVVTPGKTYRWWVEAYIPCGVPIPTPAPTNVPTTGPSPTAIPTAPPTTPPVGGRVLKYYGVDRGNPISDANYSLLSQHAVKTIVVDTDVHGSSSSWQNMMNLAAAYNFNVVVWPSDWTKPVPNCGWESPYISDSSGDFITRVKPLLDTIGGNPRFIGIVNAHEPMWSCITTVKDMETIKNQLKDYIATRFGRNDFKVWNYIDNVTDMRYLSDYTGPADIARVMDVAVTWQHCFGGAEGTCPQAQQKIINDRTAINNAGFDGRVELLYLFQTFAMGGGYRMPTETEMHDWSCNFLNTGALDGFLYYTWGACWYSSDLYCPATTHPYQNLWPIMNNVYNECVVK